MNTPSIDAIPRREFYATLAAVFLGLAVVPAATDGGWFRTAFEAGLALTAIVYAYKAATAPSRRAG